MKAPREVRRHVGLRPALAHAFKHAAPCLGLIDAHQVDPYAGLQQTIGLAVGDTDRDQLSARAVGIFGEGGAPLGLGEGGRLVRRGEDRDRSRAACNGIVHLRHEVGARAKVPLLDHDAVAGFLQLVRDPDGPTLILARVADEEVLCRWR